MAWKRSAFVLKLRSRVKACWTPLGALPKRPPTVGPDCEWPRGGGVTTTRSENLPIPRTREGRKLRKAGRTHKAVGGTVRRTCGDVETKDGKGPVDRLR